MQKLPGNNYEFTQPIQMRFNELIAGVRERRRGEDIRRRLRADAAVRQRNRRQSCGAFDGAADVKVEQIAAACRCWRSRIDKAEIARRGLSLSAVQDVIGTAIGGREAGHGVRRRPAFRDRRAAAGRAARRYRRDLKNLPVPLPGERRAPSRMTMSLCATWHSFTFTEGPNQVSRENGKRRVVVTANVRGRDIGSVVREAQAADSQAREAAARLLDHLGRTVRESRRGARSG